MKKALLIIMLVSVCSYTFGYIIVYEQMILLARLKAQLTIEDGSVQKVITEIEIPYNNRVVSHTDEKELIFYGKIYDVIYSEKTQTGIKYYCVYDETENQLRALLKDLYMEKPSQDSKTANLKHILSKLNFQYTFPDTGLMLRQLPVLTVLLPVKFSLVFAFLVGDSPPPKT